MSFETRVIDALPQLAIRITEQRWFGDKARTVEHTVPEILDVVTLDGRKAALAIVRFSFGWGPDARYFVPVIEPAPETRTTFGDLGDAFSDPAFLQWFIEGFAGVREIGRDGAWSWRVLGQGLPGLGRIDYASAKPVSGEQSNTSIVFDRQFIGKMFRRVQAGLNPDLEIGEFLSTGDRFEHAPKLFGLVEVLHDGNSIAVAAMQEYVPNRGDGWSWLLEELHNLTPASLSATVETMRTLATRTGELHVALASDHHNLAFAPELFTSVDAQSLIQRVINEIDESVEGLVKHLPPADVERIHKGMGELMGNAHQLVGTYKIRVHGDYHLGQTLRTVDNDFVLIDFEGEPSRTMEQRRMKLPALKDVAGMVRSLDYAAATILQDERDGDKRELVDRWRRQAIRTYTEAYRESVASASVPLVPAEDRVFADALNLMIAEKALYEVRYELNNRPTWLSIPLDALRSLVGMDVSANAD